MQKTAYKGLILVYVSGMAQVYSCPICGYHTNFIGNYNKHVRKPIKCKPKQMEECLLCGKQCKVGGSNLRKHQCLADESLECFEVQCVFVESAIEELKLPTCNFKQLGFAKQQPEDVALAAFRFLYLNPSHSQYQTVAVCQYDSNKLSVVDKQRHPHHGDVKIWDAKTKSEVLDGGNGVLVNIADLLDNIIEKLPNKLIKNSTDNLRYFLAHVVGPAGESPRPVYEQMFRLDHSDRLEAPRTALCDKICMLLQGHASQAHIC